MSTWGRGSSSFITQRLATIIEADIFRRQRDPGEVNERNLLLIQNC